MRIVLTGGGTGGHITPLLAVAHELKQLNPDCYIVYVGERNGKFAQLTMNNPDFDEIKTVFAGKFRRYHGESWLRRLFDIKTNLLNLRDLVLVGIGLLQSLLLVKRLKPDVVLLKGGFVGVPVGLSAAFWGKMIVTHDSDAIPGLANRLVGRWAKIHATGMPASYYGYPEHSVQHVGVLVSNAYLPVTPDLQLTYKQQINLPEQSRILLVTGGSGGAANINRAVRAVLPALLERFTDLYVVHQVGKGKTGVYDGFTHERVQVLELLQPMHAYTGASDVVVTRAGANTIAELGVQAKACIVVPNPLLTGGHQLKNAQYLKSQEAAMIVDETAIKRDNRILEQAIVELLDSPEKQRLLGKRLQAMTVPDAAKKLAMVLLDTSKDVT